MPPSDYERVSIYLSESEGAALQRLSRSFGISKNGLIKILIRDAAGLPLPAEYAQKLREQTEVTLP